MSTKIFQSLRKNSQSVDHNFPSPLKSRIYGCWLGKSIGGTLGLPAEGKMERLDYSFYEPVPTIAPPNDDLELQLVWLHLVEQGGSTLTQTDFARAWRDHIHYMWDEYGRTRWNLRRGVPLESVGTFDNPFHAGMGSPIRSEIWACLFPGDADSAAYYAAMDASLDHGTEGIAGEVFFSVMQSETAAGKDLREAIDQALRYLPAETETAVAVRFVRQTHGMGVPEWDCWKQLLTRHGNENFTHAPLNVALTIWALLYGASNFEKSILLAVNGGYDTDCTAATVGATLGLLLGEERIPTRWSEPIGDGVFVGPGIQDIAAPQTLGELTDRTMALIGKLEAMRWDGSVWEQKPADVDLARLPGSIELVSLLGEKIPWANGELPVEVKRAGGARWTWEVADSEAKQLICLARQGAKLYLNNSLLLECPAGLPYVPATHRCPPQAQVNVAPGPGVHALRIELTSNEEGQEATLILAYPNFHLCPWTRAELPHPAKLE